MTDYEKLVALIDQSLKRHIDKSCKLAENIASDLMADGATLPPCKVGQTVWVIVGRMLPYIAECEVIAVCHQFINLDDRRKVYIFSFVARNSRTPDNFYETDIGKRVFLTKEEAEAALAERSERK